MRGRLSAVFSCLYPFAVVFALHRFYAYIPMKAALALKLYPVAVNLTLLGVFCFSLVKGPTVIERFARLGEPVMTQEIVDYARANTKVWCVFFLINASIALATALWLSNAAWALYNGVIAYVLIGALMGVERLVRPRWRHLHDPA